MAPPSIAARIVAPAPRAYNWIPAPLEVDLARTEVVRLLATSFTRLFCTHSVEGRQHIPATGPYILAVNHLGMLDAPLIYTEAGGEHLAAWVAEKWERHLILGPFMRAANGIFIQRGEVDREALEAAVAWLKAGKVFGMAPEGTRSRTHQLNRGKAGIVYLAHQADVPILPAACINTEDALPALLRLRRKHAVLRFGEPFRLPPLDPARRAGSTRDQADEVMCRIAALLPERYHGAYATHPRLAELRPAGGAASDARRSAGL